ncbi:MFS transporter [Gordonia sp. 852002-50816_SCH5313054-a]|uniref:MFS transporter n=1 Tax=unclassified Gordonia (in: high G+C Gram-positive bacteria) TaxID=2657482 RepID=UPI000ACBAB53
MIRWRRADGGRSNDDPPTTPVPESETSRIDEYSRRRPAAHPGSANYPAGDGRQRGRAHASVGEAYLPPRTHNPHLPPLDESPTVGATRAMPDDSASAASAKGPKKITVMRVAAMRGRELTGRGVDKIYQAATADGADKSGLTALTLPVIANFAVDAAMAVALANTLFFAAATGESKTNVALYLALTIAPFALIAPVIGPMLDRLQHGRRIAMATTFGLRTVLALLIISNVAWNPATQQLQYDPWVLYPCALGLLVLSKSFGVLKSAVTPRVVPPSIDLPRVNSRLTTFGLIGGTIIGGAVAALFEVVLARALPIHIPGAMVWLAIISVVGAYLCLRIPSWVEVTEGEVPTSLTYHEPHQPEAGSGSGRTSRARRGAREIAKTMRQPLGRTVVAGLWGNGTIRILTGFMTLYIAFYAKSQGSHSGWMQLALLGAVGAAAGVGNAIGNGVGTRLELKNPPKVIVWATAACFVVAVLAAIFGNVLLAVVAGFVASGTSAIGKVCLDSSIQDDLPERSRASAFGRSETVLQLCWVFGAALGVLLPPKLWIGFTVVAVLLGLGLAQTVMTTRGSTLVPGFGGHRPDQAAPTVSFAAADTTRFTHPTERAFRAGERPETAHPRPSEAPTRPQPSRPPHGPVHPSGHGTGHH